VKLATIFPISVFNLIGGALGKGLFEKGKMAGGAKMSQVTVGFQFGGQAYRELLFFEDQAKQWKLSLKLAIF